MPKVNMMDSLLIEVYNQCSGARDGMSGKLDYSVLLKVAESQGLEEFDDLLMLTDKIESELSKKRESKKKHGS